MNLILSTELLNSVHAHGEASYPQEGAGLLLGHRDDDHREVEVVLPLENTFEEKQRGHRYLIDPQAMIEAEEWAEKQDLTVLGVFHSHPDHPARPSEFDREMALPWFVYVISSIQSGDATRSRAWQLADDREQFEEVNIQITDPEEEAA